jgi:hypothetical protein
MTNLQKAARQHTQFEKKIFAPVGGQKTVSYEDRPDIDKVFSNFKKADSGDIEGLMSRDEIGEEMLRTKVLVYL